MKSKGTTATAVMLGAAIIVAQVILPATFDLISSLALIGIGAFAGWKARAAT